MRAAATGARAPNNFALCVLALAQFRPRPWQKRIASVLPNARPCHLNKNQYLLPELHKAVSRLWQKQDAALALEPLELSALVLTAASLRASPLDAMRRDLPAEVENHRRDGLCLKHRL